MVERIASSNAHGPKIEPSPLARSDRVRRRLGCSDRGHFWRFDNHAERRSTVTFAVAKRTWSKGWLSIRTTMVKPRGDGVERRFQVGGVCRRAGARLLGHACANEFSRAEDVRLQSFRLGSARRARSERWPRDCCGRGLLVRAGSIR